MVLRDALLCRHVEEDLLLLAVEGSHLFSPSIVKQFRWDEYTSNKKCIHLYKCLFQGLPANAYLSSL
ncbi:hypothetical protein SBDP1_1310001 [Syntrophobacter sp. SbD1]|nr:hypothetical protein SBDP1_1310001 [Syntrophobacter sp. SbD1]